MHRFILLLAVLGLVGCGLPRDPGYPDWRQQAAVGVESEAVPPEQLILLQDQPLADSDQERLERAQRLLLVIPGVSSGVLVESLRWSEALRADVGSELVVFYDWQPGDRGRTVMSALSTDAGGEDLAAVLAALAPAAGGRTIDVLAHSGGSVILRKAALALDARSADCRFRHVVFLGTPMARHAAMQPLLDRCDRLCNVFSSYDKIVRSLSDYETGIDILGTEPPYWNRRYDRSLAGLIVRHPTYLQDGPEMRLNWASLLRDGSWPQGVVLPDLRMITLEELHRHAWWLSAHTTGDLTYSAYLARDLLELDDREKVCFGVIIAALCRDHLAWPGIHRHLRDPESPPWLRRQIYRYMATMRDSRFLDLLEYCQDHDTPNAEVVRDALRELKRARVKRP